MKKFMVLYMANAADFEKMMKESTPEQQKKGMEGWMKWMGDHKASLVDGGAPLGQTKLLQSGSGSRVRQHAKDRVTGLAHDVNTSGAHVEVLDQAAPRVLRNSDQRMRLPAAR